MKGDIETTQLIESADRISRKRALIGALASGAFLIIQFMAPPFFAADAAGTGHTRAIAWCINVVLLLLILATGGGLTNPSAIRALVNDEISRAHQVRGMLVGFWVAMVTALGIFLIDPVRSFSGREAAYLVISAAAFVGVATFSLLEHRAHADA